MLTPAEAAASKPLSAYVVALFLPAGPGAAAGGAAAGGAPAATGVSSPLGAVAVG